MSANFRKRPVDIEAIQFLGLHELPTGESVPRFGSIPPIWIKEAINKKGGETGGMWWSGDSLYIRTLEGALGAKPGDWIIQGVAGEIYPCKPDIFEATYEPLGRRVPEHASGPQ